jgi:hypothetical protein
MGIMKRFASNAKLTKYEKDFIKRSQENRNHFPIKNDEKKNIHNNK